MSKHCVVIGAGASGLASAAILAANGYSVTLVERAPAEGPVLRGFSRGGTYFDTGFHYSGGLAPGGVLDRLLRYLGVVDRLNLVAFNAAAFDRYREGGSGFEFAFPTGLDAVRSALCDAFPAQNVAVHSYLDKLAQSCATFPYLNPELDIDAFLGTPTAHDPSLAEVLDGLTEDRQLKRVLSLHTLLHGVPPDEVPFRYHAAAAGLYYHSVHTVRGGGRALVDAFVARLEELGVRRITNRAVAAIESDASGEVAGVRLEDGETLPCDVCVSTIHPKLLLALVPEGAFRRVYRRRIAALEETTSAHLLFLHCDGELPILDHSNLIFVPNGDAPELRGIHYLNRSKGSGEQSHQNGIVLIKPARFADTPGGNAPALSARPDGYCEGKQTVARTLLEAAEQTCPELAGRLTPVTSASPLTVRDYCGSPEGGLYGVKHRVGQYNPLPATRMRGLFLAGQAIGGAGVLGAVLSAFLCCGHILGHGTLQRGVRSCN